jgi:hypothetical protein
MHSALRARHFLRCLHQQAAASAIRPCHHGKEGEVALLSSRQHAFPAHGVNMHFSGQPGP